jgi:hypothetical protein
MCRLSAKLKLCTCEVASVAELAGFWVLHRFKPGKQELIIGELVMPDELDARVETYNLSMLKQRLNEADAFDVDLKPQPGDRLQLTFRCSEADASGTARTKTITYGYAWTAGRWVELPFNDFEWAWHHDQESFGELRPAPSRDDAH